MGPSQPPWRQAPYYRVGMRRSQSVQYYMHTAQHATPGFKLAQYKAIKTEF